MEKKTNNPAITKSYAKKMETISPFELKNKLIDMADESIKKIAHESRVRQSIHPPESCL